MRQIEPATFYEVSIFPELWVSRCWQTRRRMLHSEVAGTHILALTDTYISDQETVRRTRLSSAKRRYLKKAAMAESILRG
jgi:hypothetical protein